jgi:acetoin utilization deacetylase AcuC-like enzyme
MMSGSGDREFFSAYHDLLPRMVREFDPGILMVSAGYDIHRDDPLASIRVSDEGIRDMVKSILSLRLPTIFSLEGGYNLKALGGSVLITMEEMMKD